jgi:hypothetical protein
MILFLNKRKSAETLGSSVSAQSASSATVKVAYGSKGAHSGWPAPASRASSSSSAQPAPSAYLPCPSAASPASTHSTQEHRRTSVRPFQVDTLPVHDHSQLVEHDALITNPIHHKVAMNDPGTRSRRGCDYTTPVCHCNSIDTSVNSTATNQRQVFPSKSKVY